MTTNPLRNHISEHGRATTSMIITESWQSPSGQEQMATPVVPWKSCTVCQVSPLSQTCSSFKTPHEFCRHLRDFHCTKEGGSYVCKYGANAVCPSLPVDGVSDQDYEDHVARDHVAVNKGLGTNDRRSREGSKEPAPVYSVSSEPSVVQDQYKWTVFNSKINLPAVLNDPRLSRREIDFFTKTWGDGFTDKAVVSPAPHIPHISKENFRKYMKRISVRYKNHQKSQSDLQQTADAESDITFPTVGGRSREKFRKEFDVIPKIFMHPQFSLENPDTFNAVFPWTHIEASKQSSTEGGAHSSKLLQEKLSHYLDIVEVQIAKHISLRSEAFFHAMSSHDKLQENMSTTCASIKQLRSKIQQLDHSMVRGPMKIMSYIRTRSNAVTLHNKLKLMATVHQTQPTIQLLLGSNEFVGALDLISTTQEVLTQELPGVQCFRHLGSQLAEMEKIIDKMMTDDFVRYATTDLNRPITEEECIIEEERLTCIILGMIRQRKFNFIDIYREEACLTLKAIIKQTVIEAVTEADDIDMDKNMASLADQMRMLNYSQWMRLLKNAFRNLLTIIKRVQAVRDVIVEILRLSSGQEQGGIEAASSDATSENGSNHEDSHLSSSIDWNSIRISVSNDIDITLSLAECVKITKDLRDMTCQICDHAHDRSVKLLAARAKDGFMERLMSTEFVMLSRTVEGFVSDCEKVCGRRSTSLRSSLQGQANRFVSRFHDERKSKLSLILDNERWKQADVPAELQDLVTHLTTTGKLTIPERRIEKEKSAAEYLFVKSERYAVVGTVLLLLKMVVEYCQCVDDIPSATPDILSRLVELLKMFNSRTCQLILGAGALQLVGLKTITTKNLALASRCLQLVVHYLPIVRLHYEKHLQGKQSNMLKHFDSISKDYGDHIAEITNKLVAIMDGMLDSNLKKWEVKAPVPSTCFRNICKQVAKLHEAIVDLLPPQQILEIFQKVDSSFKLHLRAQLIKLGVTNDSGPQHGLVAVDVAFYTQSMKALPGLENLQENIDSIWDKKPQKFNSAT